MVNNCPQVNDEFVTDSKTAAPKSLRMVAVGSLKYEDDRTRAIDLH
jgi:hypothetical protein